MVLANEALAGIESPADGGARRCGWPARPAMRRGRSAAWHSSTAPSSSRPNALQVQLGIDVAWLDVRDDPVKLTYVAEHVFGTPPRWGRAGCSSATGSAARTGRGRSAWSTGTLATSTQSPPRSGLHHVVAALVGAAAEHRLSRARAHASPQEGCGWPPSTSATCRGMKTTAPGCAPGGVLLEPDAVDGTPNPTPGRTVWRRR